MKHWLNSWEKYIGKRLSNAEAVPGKHVWASIEQELDAELIVGRNRTVRRTVGIALLLLLLSGTYLLTNQPVAERALAGYFLHMDEAGNSTAWVYEARADISDGETQAAILEPVSTDVASQIVVASLMEQEESTAQPIDAVPVESPEGGADKEVFILELAEIQDNNYQLEVPLQAFAASPVHAYYQTIDLSGRAGGVELSNALAEVDIRSIEHKARTGKRELLSRIAASTDVNSPLLVWSDNPHLIVNAQTHSMAVESSYMEIGDVPYAGQSLASNDIESIEIKRKPEADAIEEISTEAYSDEAVEIVNEIEASDDVAEIEEEVVAMATQEKEVAEMAEVSWMADAMVELTEWKELMNEMSETEKDELDELIEEAVIEEEDPLTRKNNEAMDLYRSYNVNKGFHIGLIAGFQNTWVTKETRNTEIDRSVVNSKMAPGYQVGINMGYDITDHFGLMMEFKYSDEGGRYYNPLKDRSEHLDLKYFEVPIYAKVKHSKMTEKLRPIVFNYLVGFSYSDLRKVSTTIDGSIDHRFGQDYNTTQWGLTAGFDFDFYVHKNFFWTIGTRAGVSGDSKAFPKFKGEDGNSSITIDAGIYTRFSFRLPGR